MKHSVSAAIVCALLAVSLCLSAGAENQTDIHCFSAEEFSPGVIDGIYLSQVPLSSEAELLWGARSLRAGDVIPSQVLGQLRIVSGENAGGSAVLVYCPILDGHLEDQASMTFSLGKPKDKAPEAEDAVFETYKNIANTGTLSAKDPEGEAVTFTIVRQPRRGTVVLEDDGKFTYTPEENKVGKDSFTYTASDPAGNLSNEAVVSVQILKPLDKAAYSDMVSDKDHFYAVWMQENGLFSGERVAGNLCFCPEKEVTRGEFLAMTMTLLGSEISPDLSTGFADEETTPVWMQPYVASALRSGMIAGVTTDDGLIFRPTASVTKAEAAVMLQGALGLSAAGEAQVFAEYSDVAVWAQPAYSALTGAGIRLNPGASAETLSRREAAKLLWQAQKLAEK